VPSLTSAITLGDLVTVAAIIASAVAAWSKLATQLQGVTQAVRDNTLAVQELEKIVRSHDLQIARLEEQARHKSGKRPPA
jgi:hypothetical protein